MQYGYDINTYKRIYNSDKKDYYKDRLKQKTKLKTITIFFMVFFVTRVVLINSTAPFGIAIIISTLYKKDNQLNIIIGIAGLLGYFSLINNTSDLGSYIIIVTAIILIRFIVKDNFNHKAILFIYTFILVEKAIYKAIYTGIVPGMSFFQAMAETFTIVPIYLVISYSLSCFKFYNSRHIYNSEEQISMAILIALTISGTWGINIFNISVRNVLALSIIQIISYVNGASVGSAVGVTVGIINGMSSRDMSTYISIYGLTGLIPGVFKDAGRCFSVIGYAIATAILILYSDINGKFKLIEILISSGIFLCIPNKIIKSMEEHFNKELKEIKLKEDYLIKIKENISEKLNELPKALFSIHNILTNLNDNKNLSLNSKGNAMVENLAARVCANCSLKNMCWKREMHYTYSSISELINNYENKNYNLPLNLENRCIKLDEMRVHTEEIINNFVINEMWQNRLREGREVLAIQIGSIAGTVNNIINKFDLNLNFNIELENSIKNILRKNCIDFEEVVCMIDKEQRNHISMKIKDCHGIDICYKEIVPILKNVLQKNICVSDEGCRIDSDSGFCNISFEEMPQFFVSTHVARKCKAGEKYNGDSYFFSKLKYGKYMCIISDGMGYGPEASRESKGVIELVERLTNAEFDTLNILNMVNSVMTLKFSENEKFSTVDLATMDLFTGEIEFNKIGAASSYIKKDNNVYKIISKSLPIGVLEDVDVQSENYKIGNGDIFVMVSDGVEESNKFEDENWIKKFLQQSEINNPKLLAEGLIEQAMRFTGKAEDDMTIMVSKVYKKY